jgi:hypothetical protein
MWSARSHGSASQEETLERSELKTTSLTCSVTDEGNTAWNTVSPWMDMLFQPPILQKLALKLVDLTSSTLSYELHGHGGMHLREIQRRTRFGNPTEKIRQRHNWQLENDGFLETKTQWWDPPEIAPLLSPLTDRKSLKNLQWSQFSPCGIVMATTDRD